MSKAQEVIEALLKHVDNVPADLKEQIEGLDFISSEDANARAASERKRAERKAQQAIEQYQAQIDELNDKVEELTSSGDGSKADQKAKELERLQAKYEKATGQINELTQSLETTRRDALISSVASGISFTDGIAPSVRDYAIKEHFKDYTNEDLQDSNLVGEALKSFVTENAGIVVTNKPSGAGTGNGASNHRDSGSISRSDIKPGQMTREQIDKAWAAAGSGELS